MCYFGKRGYGNRNKDDFKNLDAGHKLLDQAGESIAETLVALLVSVLALTMLAGAITTSSNIVKKSKDKLGAYYTQNESLVEMSSESGSATITISETTTGAGVSDKLSDQKKDVTYYKECRIF